MARPAASLLLLLIGVGCAAPAPPWTPRVTSSEPSPRTVPVVPTAVPTAPAAPPPSPFDALPGWRDDRLAEVLPAWRRTCERLLRAPGDRPVGRDGLGGTVADWQPACRAIVPTDDDPAAARAYFERWFVPVPVTSQEGDRGLFTGYYEPELRGSRTRSRRFRVPLYGRPRDLVTAHGNRPTGRRVRGRLLPYWTRAQIVAGALRRTARPLLWVDDAIEAFFLEIQGSGRVALEDGSRVQVQYDSSNGRAYVPIGRALLERHAIERGAVSLQSIRAWLAAHPAEAQAVMNQNPSYVFFHERAERATGAEGVVLTAGRSLAVDNRFIPLGTPLFLDVEALAGVGVIQRLVVAQDTGGAIRGAVRGDLFWGAGPEAYDRAGRMQQRGRYWRLVPLRDR